MFAQAMERLCERHHPASIALACSGGLDSMVLLHLAHSWCKQADITLHAFHVHHGLSPQADDWLAHCASSCAALGIGFDHRRVVVAEEGKGIEASARSSRYGALGEMCRVHQVTLLLTAHHLDDQAETVLLQLLRGAGPAGLSGMDADNHAPALLGSDDIVMARPLLAHPRSLLEQHAGASGLRWVDDESNLDARHPRNALRHQVMPVLAQAFPGFTQRVARSSAHCAASQRLLDAMAEQDLVACQQDGALLLDKIAPLGRDRTHNLLRHVFAKQDLALPSTAWLEQMVHQLLTAREGAQLKVTHPQCLIRRHRGRLFITPRLPELAGMRDPDDIGVLMRSGQDFQWSGQAHIDFPDYGGSLHFDAADEGLDAAWLRTQLLTIDFRQGGERLKLAHNRPTRGLKAHFQALGVPAWERERLPVVKRGIALLFAAGIGHDCQHLGQPGPGKVQLRWVAD